MVGSVVMVWDLSMLDLGFDSPILGQVLFLNGDLVDVVDVDGVIDCWPIDWVWVRLSAPD